MAQTSTAKGAAQNKSANGIDPRRQAALDTALAQVEKSFGKGSAMRLGDRPEQDVEVIPTGSLALDMALGIGGLPKGRIVAVGNRTKVKVVKNKMAPPFKTAEFDVLYGEGISKEGSVLDMALQVNVVKKSGSWFTYDGDQLGQGRENVRQFLKDNPELTEEIENKVKAEFGLIEPTDQFAEDGDDVSAKDVKGEEKAKADAAKPETAKGAAKSSKPADKA